MARLPQPGSDKGTWGDILNDFLGQSLNADGSLKSSALPTLSSLGGITPAQVDTKISTQATTDLGQYLKVTGTTGQFIDVTKAPYNCLGDNATDNTTALTNAMNDAATANLPIFLPRGTYKISSPIPFKASLMGSGTSTMLSPTSTFSGGYLLDFNSGGSEFRFIRDIRLSMGGKTIAAQGSSGDASGSANTLFMNVYFTEGSASVYAVGGASTTSVGGMLTGATFLHCRWENCALWANVGINQDDVTFIGCRFFHSGSTPAATDAPLVLAGQNVTMLNTYMYVRNSALTSGDIPIVKIGSNPASVKGMFVECLTGSNFTHLFYAVNPNYQFLADTLKNGMAGNSGFVALCRANLAPTTNSSASMEIKNFSTKSSSDTYSAFEVMATATTGTVTANLRFSGIDTLPNVVTFAAGGTSSAAKVNLIGVKSGLNYAHYVTPAGGASAYTIIGSPSVGAVSVVDNFTATTDPLVTSDSAAGYSPGSKWINISNKTMYHCVDATAGAAVWQRDSADIQTFTTPGTWTKPAWATTVTVSAIGGGGGGGSGMRGAAGTARYGGGGGAGGTRIVVTIPASIISNSVGVNLGDGGAGGAAVTTDSTVGNTGATPVQTSFGSYVRALSSIGGSGGTASAGTGASANTGQSSGGSGGSSSISATAGNGLSSPAAGPGGAAGGGISAADVAFAGGVGAQNFSDTSTGGTSGAAPGGAGGNGSSMTIGSALPGAGGGGGGANTSGAGGNGGIGGTYGAGGGGGGASVNGFNSGAGGNGGPGIVVVMSQ